jgi:diguanylate cyclase (GGDEF)-like protein
MTTIPTSTPPPASERPRQYTPLQVAERSLAGSLPSLPIVAFDVLQICQDPRSDIGQLVERMSLDPVLASKVLRMANSAYYKRGSDVTSLQRAAVMLGLRALKVLALGFTLANELPRNGSEGGFDLGLYWNRSLANAVAGRAIAGAIDSAYVEEAFVCGLLSHLGKLAIARVAPEQYLEAVSRCDGWPTEAVERDVLGFTNGEVAELLLASWGLPQAIVAAAANAEHGGIATEASDRETAELASVTALAVRAAGVIFGVEATPELDCYHELAAESFGLSVETADEILRGIQDGVLETAEAFAVQLPPGRTYAEILDGARDQLVAVSLDNVIDLQDATRTLEELSEQNQELETRALTDKLTELPNRAALEDALYREANDRVRAEASLQPLGVLMIDIDTFKTLNDGYGHQDGDLILRTVARLMASVTRGSDLLSRYGGDEFCVVMRRTTQSGIAAAAERLRHTVESTPVVLRSGARAYVTISVGAALSTALDPDNLVSALIERADAALYRAKAKGRNRVEIASSTFTPVPGQRRNTFAEQT